MQTVALLIFIVSYLGIIVTRFPKINIDRPSSAFFGAVAMIVSGVLSFQEAVNSVDYNTIALLFGMMIIISTLQIDGFFSFIAHKTIAYSRNQFRLLVIIVFITGISSAFLVNDAVVLLFTPIVITICRSSGINPVPFLIAEILSSNVGSAMTMTGNPQNMLIGLNSNISYLEFLIRLLPVSLLGMLVIILVIKLFYPKNFKFKRRIHFAGKEFEYNFASMRYSVPIFIAVIILFFFSTKLLISLPLIALSGASLILIFGKIKPSKIIKEIDWVLLVFFASLFIVVKGIEKNGVFENILQSVDLHENISGIISIHGLSLIISQIVSNVPFTMVMLPLMKIVAGNLLWLSLASASTLAGNATIIGAMANLIVIEQSEKHNIKIGFFEFFKSGILVTIVSMLISTGILFLYSFLNI